MDREQLATVAREYDERGAPLHELLRIDRSELSDWLRGARIPRKHVSKLEWWASQLRVQKALEASGLPECEDAKRLDARALSTIMGKSSSKEQDRAARAVLDHEASCELCRKRDAVRKSAGPLKGEPFRGYHKLNETPEDRASGLWVFAAIACFGFAVIYSERGLEPDPTLPWLIAWMGVVMPWLLWEGVPRSRSNQIAALLCGVSGIVGLFLTDFSILLENGWSPLLLPALFICVGLWVRWRSS